MPAFQGPAVPLLAAVTVDCQDLALADFWASLLSVEITHRDEQWAFLGYAPDRKVTIWFQKVPEKKGVKNRVHLDFAVPDLEATEVRILDLGGSKLAAQSWGEHSWVTFADPEGNEFDVMQVATEA
ncbi:MAG: VOC family protein [Acidimicrobiia bacterium]|nr:VOC family protein [Acidimicrobiia bacterium]